MRESDAEDDLQEELLTWAFELVDHHECLYNECDGRLSERIGVMCKI